MRLYLFIDLFSTCLFHTHTRPPPKPLLPMSRESNVRCSHTVALLAWLRGYLALSRTCPFCLAPGPAHRLPRERPAMGLLGCHESSRVDPGISPCGPPHMMGLAGGSQIYLVDLLLPLAGRILRQEKATELHQL